ncbi:MAG: HAD-IA family hydrolase [Pseudomonadota bacterium]
MALRALLLDLYGTALFTRRTVGETYAALGRDFGVEQDVSVLEPAFHAALAAVQDEQAMSGDGRPFWREVVRRCTGCGEEAYFERIYTAMGDPGAYRLDPTLPAALGALRAAGFRLGVVSNADTRTRAIVEGLGLDALVDTVVISAEVGIEKPDPRIFHLACDRLGVAPAEAVHVGDSLGSDVRGARGAGLTAWRYGHDVADFAEIARRLLAPIR